MALVVAISHRTEVMGRSVSTGLAGYGAVVTPSARQAATAGTIGVRGVEGRLAAGAVGNRTRESLFFVPSLLILGGAIAAVVAAVFDRNLPTSAAPDVLQIQASAANVLLATITGATITAVSVVFSITIVSVQLASGQFSPRVVRSFFRDRYAQTVIGVLAATFAFCVVALYAMAPSSAGGDGHGPVVTTALAVLLAFASIATIVVYLDHSARGLYVGRIADHVMDETLARVRALAPAGDGGDEPGTEPAPADGFVVRSLGDSGWVQQISLDGIAAATPPESTVWLETRAGAYVTTGTPLAVISPPPTDGDQVTRDVNRSVVLGAERTMQQDLDFGLRQLTDIALRALSPAVNDPTTAIEVVLRLGSILHELLAREIDHEVIRADNGTVLLRPLELSHADYIRHAFLQIRRVVPAHPVVATAYLRTLRMVALTAQEAGRVPAAEAAEAMVARCLEMCERADLLDDELEMLHRAAEASSPIEERRRARAGGRGSAQRSSRNVRR